MLRHARNVLAFASLAVFGVLAWYGPAHHLLLTNVDACSDLAHHGPSESQDGDGHCAVCHFQKYSAQHVDLARVEIVTASFGTAATPEVASALPRFIPSTADIRGPPSRSASA